MKIQMSAVERNALLDAVDALSAAAFDYGCECGYGSAQSVGAAALARDAAQARVFDLLYGPRVGAAASVSAEGARS